MTSRARTLSAVALCTVLVAALAMILLALPGTQTAPEPIEVSLDFDTFVPGIRQTQTSVVDVPVQSRVSEAGVAVATGFARDIEWSFDLCQGAECRPLAADVIVTPGVYRLVVSAMLDAASTQAGDGRVAGRVLLVESSRPVAFDRSQLVWLATIGLIAVVLVAAVVRRTRTVMT